MAKAVAFDHVDYVRTHGFTPANELAFEHCVRAARTLAEIHLARGCLVRAHIGQGTTCIGAVGTTVAHSAYVCVVFAREDGTATTEWMWVRVRRLRPVSLSDWQSIDENLRRALVDACWPHADDDHDTDGSCDKSQSSSLLPPQRPRTRAVSSSPKDTKNMENTSNSNMESLNQPISAVTDNAIDHSAPSLIQMDMPLTSASPPKSPTSPTLVHKNIYTSDHLDFTTLNESPISLVRVGAYAEVQCADDPRVVHICRVEHNYGGLLVLISVHGGSVSRGFALHCAHQRLHAAGWTLSLNGREHACAYADGLTEEMRVEAMNNSITYLGVRDLSSSAIERHQFEVGMRIELLDPATRAQFVPAAVTEVLSPFYVRVVRDRCKKLSPSTSEITVKLENNTANMDDSIQTEDQSKATIAQSTTADIAEPWLVCSRNSHFTFPPTWCARNSIRITPPDGYPDVDFTWAHYRAITSLTTYDQANESHFVSRPTNAHLFEPGSRLEIMLDSVNGEVCFAPATVCRTYRHLLWLRKDNLPLAGTAQAYDCRSLDIYPCGFANRHGLPLLPVYTPPSSSVTTESAEYSTDETSPFLPVAKPYMCRMFHPNNTSWCSRLYTNIHCHHGPYISRNLLLRNMQTFYETAPLHLQVQTILQHLLNACHRPPTVLDLWKHRCFYDDVTTHGKVPIKFSTRRNSYFKKTYHTQISVPSSSEDLSVFLWHLFTQLDACPNMISSRPLATDERCPYKCDRLDKLEWTDTTKYALTGYKAQRTHPRTLKRGKAGAGGTRARIIDVSINPIGKRPRPAAAKLVDKTVRTPKTGSAADLHDKTSLSSPIRRPVTRGVKVHVVGVNAANGPSPSHRHKDPLWSPTVAQAAAGRIKHSMRRHMSQTGQGDRRTSTSATSSARAQAANQQTTNNKQVTEMHQRQQQQQRLMYTFAQIRDKPIGITLPQRRVRTGNEGAQHGHHQRASYDGAGPSTSSALSKSPMGIRLNTSSCSLSIMLSDDEDDVLLNSARAIPPVPTDPGTWTSHELCAWIQRSDMPGAAALVPMLLQEEFDGHSFMLLTLNDCINYLGLKFGTALKLATIVSELKQKYLLMFAQKAMCGTDLIAPTNGESSSCQMDKYDNIMENMTNM